MICQMRFLWVLTGYSPCSDFVISLTRKLTLAGKQRGGFFLVCNHITKLSNFLLSYQEFLLFRDYDDIGTVLHGCEAVFLCIYTEF